MKITKAVITCAAHAQHNLPLQTLVDRDSTEKSVLQILIEEVLRAHVEEICLVVRPSDEASYKQVVGEHAGRLCFVHQTEPLGYGHAIHCAKNFVGNEAFLHLVGDHLYVSRSEKGCAQHLVEVAEAESCAVSAVQATREHLLAYYGTVGGQREPNHKNLYRVETVIEKPTPTEAEQKLIVPGLRTGFYLCFFGMHVLTPTIMDILEQQLKLSDSQRRVTLSTALAELAKQEQYLALEKTDWRYDMGVKYGVLTAQLALALSGQDRDEVLSSLVSLLATREIGGSGR
jgi:UTP--glucose-1-phosphate uridylyltransferase